MPAEWAESSCLLQKLYQETRSPPARQTYPRIQQIPRTPASRLERNVSSADLPAWSSAPGDTKLDMTREADTVLYLAYGSNLCAETFLGARGIRPLSQVNVHAPSLRLTFDLVGLPYTEPCFANTAPRKLPEQPKLPDPRDPPKQPPLPTPPEPGPVPMPGEPERWDKGLIGVVYEVTRSDYQHIIATEGGGASYKEIVVPCLAIPPRMSVPERPPGRDIPRPFLARTLCAPRIPDAPDDDGDGDKEMTHRTDGGGDGPKDPRKKWYWKFIRGPRREEGYAQPSARYLKLITDGAAEHDLPEAYQRYLASLQPYTITTRRQEWGKMLMTALALPVMLMVRFVVARLADDKGKLPTWAAVLMGMYFSGMWMLYDYVLKPLFGDGERTEEADDGQMPVGKVTDGKSEGSEGTTMVDEEHGLGYRQQHSPWSERFRWYGTDTGTADEKTRLIQDWDRWERRQ